MEDPRQFQNLKMPEATVPSFPPHRRRPIRSRTYLNLIQLLSQNCHTDSSQLDGSSKGVDLRRGSADNIQINNGELKSAELLVPNDILVQGTGINKSVANVGFQDGDFGGEQATISELGSANLVTDGDEVVTRSDCMSCGDFVTGDKEQESMDNVDVGSMGQLTVDKEFSIEDFSEVLDSGFGGDMVSELSNLEHNSKENNSALEVNTSKEFEHQAQLKEMELEKLVSMSGMDDDIEEGEIYVEAGVSDMLIDPLSNNVESLGRISIHTSEDNGYKEDLTCKSEDQRFPHHDTYEDKENDCVKVEHRAPSRPSLDIQSQSCDDMKTHIFAVPTYLESLSLISIIHQKHVNDNPISAITQKEGDGRTSKRKNDSSAKERKAEKKKRKRAEKNRKLGVKRLKLQTVSKPTKIVYCRYYLQGKCHEGEKCKFSHDTTPLTKSKPCSHFARNSCMKGDDCPYDHQLSKYPCNNFTSTGVCNRGADCLFSHKISENQITPMTHNGLKPELKSEQCKGPDKAGSLTAASIDSRPEVKFLPQLCNSHSSNSSNILTSHQKDDAKFSSPGKSDKREAKFVAKPFSRTAAHAPKGVSFLTGTSLGPNHTLKMDELVKKSGDAVEVVHGTNPKIPTSPDKLKKKSEDLTSQKPRGVNFLSFAQSSLDVSSFKTISNFFPDGFKEAGKLVMVDLSDGKQARPLPKNGELFEDHGQTSRNVTDSLWNLNSEANKTPVAIPSRINSVSPDKNQPDETRPLPKNELFEDHGRTSRNVTDLPWNLNGEANKMPAAIPSRINSLSQDEKQPDESSLGELNGNKYVTFLSTTEEKPTTHCKFPVKTHVLPFGGSRDQSASSGYPQAISSSFKMSLLSNTPNLVQKAVQSTLAFAAKFEPEIKSGPHLL